MALCCDMNARHDSFMGYVWLYGVLPFVVTCMRDSTCSCGTCDCCLYCPLFWHVRTIETVIHNLFMYHCLNYMLLRYKYETWLVHVRHVIIVCIALCPRVTYLYVTYSIICDMTCSCVTWLIHVRHMISVCIALSCDITCLNDAVCCSVLQCVAVCCSALQCVALCCSVLRCVAVYCSVL